MAVPDLQTLMLPLLKFASTSDGEERNMPETREHLSKVFDLDDKDMTINWCQRTIVTNIREYCFPIPTNWPSTKTEIV